MLRFLWMIALLVALPSLAPAAVGEQAQAAAAFLHSGRPDQAVASARHALKKGGLTAAEREALLDTVARAELMRTTNQQFQQVKSAIQALETYINEFPDSAKAPEFRWRQAWLWWKSEHFKEAIAAAREIIAEDQQPKNLRRAWLLMARAHLHMNQYAYARSDLLQYGLQVRSNSREQAVGMAWMAVVDAREKRPDAAFKSLHAVYRKWPKVITSESQLFAIYIELLDRQKQYDAALKLAEAFIRQYSDTPESARVRLIRANLHARNPQTIAQAIEEYAILADRQAETTIGRKAFMRKLMLQFREEKQRDKLLPVLVSLKKMADENQMSDIEDEAMLDMARLWTRLTLPANDHARKGAAPMPPALEAYARASASHDPRIAAAAKTEGAIWMKKYTQILIRKQQWLQAVTTWRHYPQLHPSPHTSQMLRLGVAHAMRMLMLFEPAEAMLKQLYRDNRMSIIGQRVMLERGKLWLDRRDPDGVKKMMHWLNRHEFSIFRPEMLLIVARMQLDQQQAELARQTLLSVHAADIAVESRPLYWQTRAEISEALSDWRRAARAWERYRASKGADVGMGLGRQADNLFAAGEFAAALKLYQQIPEPERDSGWQYHVGVCQLRSGAVRQGVARLQQLAGAKVDKKQPDHYIALAKLALADKQAKKLLGEQP